MLILALLLSAISFNAQAFWGNNNFYDNNGWGNNWPVWTPMYWMEEFSGNNNNYYNGYYGNANPWNNSPNPWSNGFANGAQGSSNGAYAPYFSGGSNAGYPMGYPQAYRPLSGYQTMPLVPSRGPTAIRP